MFKIIALFFFVAVCNASPSFKCGEMPSQVYRCLGSPEMIPRTIVRECMEFENPCSRNNCIYEKLNWIKDNKVINSEVAKFYDNVAATRPEWTTAVEKTKANCLSGPLPVLGSYFDCPSYDLLLCSIANFFKNAQPSRWVQSEECDYVKQYVALCPICPHDCSTGTAPEGSCNACHITY